VDPGERYISRVRSNHATHSGCFAQINDRINEEMAAHPEYAMMLFYKKKSIFRRIVLGMFVMELW
jgi:amidophosphoribosyltransferase